MTDPAISVVIPTRNRSASVRRTIEGVLRYADTVPCEILVADNGSTDDTATVVAELAAGDGRVRYILEPRAGASHARNAAIAAARAPIIGFLDDDEDIGPEWLTTIVTALRTHPDVDAVGGRLEPVWESAPPAWLRSRPFAGPVSLIDGGGEPFRVTAERWLCFGGGNSAFRRDVLVRLGGFDAAYPRSQDRELFVRFLLSGGVGMYLPQMVVHHHIEGNRLTRDYYRRWYATEGRMRAGYAFDELFLTGRAMARLPATAPRVLGVSTAIYRRFAVEVIACMRAAIEWRREALFAHELQVRYLWNYIRRRVAIARQDSTRPALTDLVHDVVAMVRMKIERSA